MRRIETTRVGLRMSRTKPTGIVLILVAGVLTILAALGTTLYALTYSQVSSAVRYTDMVRADLLAQSGIHEAVARLRISAYIKTEDPTDNWYTVDWLNDAKRRTSFRMGDGVDNAPQDGIIDNEPEPGETYQPYARALTSSAGDNSDRFILEVEDAGGKININACDNLAVVLDNLCRLIGPPLMVADADLLQPRRWFDESGSTLAAYGTNAQDTKDSRDVYYELDAQGRPVQNASGQAVYGDGYAIAGYRSHHGPLGSVEELKNALTFVDRNANGIADDPLERMEIEAKYAALKPYVTLASWVDTTTSCVGKFEWVRDGVLCTVANLDGGSPIHPDVSISKVNCQVLIDRDKSWVEDKPESDPLNQRGSLRGSYVSIMNGHGAGQLRRIATNGTDWIALRSESGADERMTVAPGPISSYMIIAAEDARLDLVPNTSPAVYVPHMNANGTLVDHPDIDYSVRPLCIHRSPVNINTASDKVLAALFMGLNVQHGHYLAIGTDADADSYYNQTKATAWYKDDPKGVIPTFSTVNGLKRIPACSGKLVFDRPVPPAPSGSSYAMGYINGYGTMNGTGLVNEAVELAQRIMIARSENDSAGYFDAAANAVSAAATATAYERKPFTSWDDFYFRVVKPWDDKRREDSKDGSGNYHKRLVAKMLMANANPNTDILKFNPNIEWIDRWGRNFVDMEPVMIYDSDPVTAASTPIYYSADAMLKSSQRNAAGTFISGAYIIRSYRYRSDDLIDKTDLNRSTTELAFNSNGIFEITSTGQVIQSVTGQLLAERKTEAAIKVYDVWTESTQRQFVNGRISRAFGNRGTACSGQIARDAYNVASGAYNQANRLALNTLPEPLVPLTHRIQDDTGNNNNAEAVTQGGSFLDAYGNARTNPFTAETGKNVPDVIANRLLPAQWDGQIVLATNTSAYDPSNGGDKDTFLATFDGDLDTADCKGNGREQAKTPQRTDGHGDRVRVVDTFGLLGLLNDTNQDMDPGLTNDPVTGFHYGYRFTGLSAALKGTNPAYYWNNVTMRMGDLRTDGVYLSSPGVSGNDATLKYLVGDSKENFTPDSADGNCITLWFKSTWHQDDLRTHEFFNASNPSNHLHGARGCYLTKYGQYVFSFQDFNAGIGHSGNRTKTNDLAGFWENGKDEDMGGFLHGGYDWVPKPGAVAAIPQPESPSFRIQPFRWQFTGMRRNVKSASLSSVAQNDGPRGHWMDPADYNNPKSLDTVTHHVRPFIDSQLDPEGKTTWTPRQFWVFRSWDSYVTPNTDIANTGSVAIGDFGARGQDVKWKWADPAGTSNEKKVFSINNLNLGNITANPNNDKVLQHYRFMPEDGTYAVIDELKISSKDRVLVGTTDAPVAPDWDNDRVVREQSLSRYYLPPSAADRSIAPEAGGPPTFTSQTLMQSRRGFDKTMASEQVTLVRVTWTVFTPRFMHEYKEPSNTRFKRTEYLTYNGKSDYYHVNAGATQETTPRAFRGPFDYVAYNDSSFVGDAGVDLSGRVKSYISVARPTPVQYGGQAHATKGVEIELLDDTTPLAAQYWDTAAGSFANAVTNPMAGTNSILTNPDVANRFGTAALPTRIRSDRLRYRVRYMYPVDPLVDPFAGGSQVNPTHHLLLDTPVFDDISVTYYTKTRIMAYRSVWE